MSTHYVIQRWRLGKWEDAWGFKPRSRPKAGNDAEAVSIFEKEIGKSRGRFRLITFAGFGFGTSVLPILEKVRCAASKRAPS